jgi:hypothetical protein
MGYKIVVDKGALMDQVTVDELIGMQEGSLKVTKVVMGRFVQTEDGTKLSAEEGAKVIGSLTMRQLTELGGEFTKKAEVVLVPPTNGAVST